MKLLFKYLVVAALLMGCVPEPLPLTLPQYEQKIVVGAQVIPDYLMVVGLTRSFTALSSAGNSGSGDDDLFDQILVDSALVTITSSQGIDTLFSIAPGVYASLNELEQPGGLYTLEVYDYDIDERVTATTAMQRNIPLDTVFSSADYSGDTTMYAHLEFTDPVDEDNFYLLTVFSQNPTEAALDINFFFDNGSNNLEYQEIFTDRDSNGVNFKRMIAFPNLSKNDSVVVSLANVSEDYYAFLLARSRSGNLLSDITNEPINYPSNVNDGLGFFNAYYPSLRFLQLGEGAN